MKFRFLFLLLVCGVFLAAPLPSEAADETNSLPAEAAVSPELIELRNQLDGIQRGSAEATQKWEALMKQNASLSNRLAGLHQSLLTQQERELELGKQSNAFHLRVMAGAAAVVFLVILLSFWFQLRCFNRVVELSRLPNVPPATPLLEGENSPSMKLLSAVKLLESRIQQLEFPHPPIAAATPANGAPSELGNGRAEPVSVVNNGSPHVEMFSTPPDYSVLLAKGQILLDMDRLEEAMNCFQEVLHLDPSNSEAHLKKGMALERMNRLENALSSYQEAIRLNPRRAVAYVYKARVLQGLHRYDEALTVYDSALGKNSQKPLTPAVSN